MCRYAQTNYNVHMACFDCQKMFRPIDRRHVHCDPEKMFYKGPFPCPECKQPMVDMGLDFKAPKKNDNKQWQKVKLLHLHGIHFTSCGCSGPGYRPGTLSEAKEWVQDNSRVLVTEKTLANILRRGKRSNRL